MIQFLDWKNGCSVINEIYGGYFFLYCKLYVFIIDQGFLRCGVLFFYVVVKYLGRLQQESFQIVQFMKNVSNFLVYVCIFL